MHAIDRREKIKQTLLTEGRVSTTELARQFSVSTETIRKDIGFLEESGIAKKGYGGAVIISELSERTFLQKSDEQQEAKQRIAQAALQLIHEKDILILDAGSTTAALARLLPDIPGITVITNSLPAAHILHGRVHHLFFLGGTLQVASGASTGSWGRKALSELHADIAFIGTSGFAQMDGPCVENFAESETKRAMIESANRAILLADSSKARRDAMVRYASWSAFERLITDEGISEKAREELQDRICLDIAP